MLCFVLISSRFSGVYPGRGSALATLGRDTPTPRDGEPSSAWLGAVPVHLTGEGGRADPGWDGLGLGAGREGGSTKSSKLLIDFCPVGGSPGTSKNGIGF